MIENNYYVLFGDLSDSKAPGYSKREKEDGTSHIQIRLKPSEYTIRKYNVKNTEYNPDGYIHKEYDEIYLIREENQEGNQSILLACDFNGKDIGFTKKIENIWKQNALYWRTSYKNLLKKVARLQYDLRQAYESIEQMESSIDRRYMAKKKILGTEIVTPQPPPPEMNE